MRLLEPGFEADGLTEISLGGEADPETLDIDSVDRVNVVFAGFKDGRGFSLGAMLREHGFKGELRASGDLLPDHASMLARSGFDSAELPPGASPEDWRRMLASFSAVYQPAADGTATIWEKRATTRAVDEVRSVAAALNAELRGAPAEVIIDFALERFPGRIAMLSSFGAEAAVGLHMLSKIAPATPVLFLDTDRHFHPTLQYRDRLTARFGLSDVRVLTPKDAEARDRRGDLWRTDPDACCTLRKVEPLASVAQDFDVLITGRKRFHGGARMRLPVVEEVGGQIRVNPLANWTGEEIEAYFVRYDLPRHPLTQGGYRSIGCWPCTQPSSEEEDVRAGRWAGLDKSECGIHMPDRWVAALERRRAS
jgi:phosphoadenylyl-sulfate reductase (thioredoxin)